MSTTLLKIKIAGLCLLLFFVGLVLRAESPDPSHSPNLFAEVLPILKAKYIDPQALQGKAGKNLSDLIAHSDGKISIHAEAPSSAPIVTAFLPGNIIYWRLASFVPEAGWPDLIAQFDQWTHQGSEGIILDLRSNTAPDDYAGAAKVADLFALPGTGFYLNKNSAVTNLSSDNIRLKPAFNQPIVILVNNQTVGAAEALAACLKADGALVVGRTTRGKAAIFEEQKLSSGQVLRYAVGQVCLADGTSLWGHPVSPDIGLVVDDRMEKNALALIERHAVPDVIGEAVERHRMSEAALVRGDDPELDNYLASHEKKPGVPHPGTASSLFQDVALVDALDSLKAIQVSQRRPVSPAGDDALPETSSALR